MKLEHSEIEEIKLRITEIEAILDNKLYESNEERHDLERELKDLEKEINY